MKTRRVPPRSLSILALAWVLVAGCGASDDSIRSLTILHTNDLHARFLPDDEDRGGFAHLAVAIRSECARAAACLVLDAGDLVQGSPVSSVHRGVPVFDVANLMGIDVSTLGNHEFDYGWEMIAEFLEAAEFPVVTANVVDGEGTLLADEPYVVLEAGGIRIGVIGVLTKDLPYLTTSDKYGPWKILPVVETVERYLSEVAKQADLVVVLGHLVDEEETAILERARDVPVVVSGHGHDRRERPKVVDGRVGVRVEAYGRELGRLDLRIDTRSRTVVDWSWKAIPIDASRIEPDPSVAKRVDAWESEIAERADVTIGESRRHFPRGEVRTLVERALRETMQADLAYVNPGGIRDALPRGPILVRHVWNVMPFDNHVVVGEFTGRELPRWLAEERGLDPRRFYRLATMDFCVATWRDRGTADLAVTDTGLLVRDVIVDWIRKRGVIE
jgi:2',3'-cyclic-nucleotide 2'-phosphodiesterase (5'-nucleotidase family)